MNIHKHQLYLLKQHSESLNIWPAIIRISTEGKSLIMKFGPGQSVPELCSAKTCHAPPRYTKLNVNNL